MVLTENLKKYNILTKIKSKNRWGLIEELVNHAVKNKDLSSDDSETIKKALIDREKSMSTGIGNGVAIPHCTTTKLNDIVIIMSISQKGIEFNAIDNQPVKIVILLLVPKNKLTQHIKTLANIAKMMSEKNIREKILSLKTADSIFKEVEKYEKRKSKS